MIGDFSSSSMRWLNKVCSLEGCLARDFGGSLRTGFLGSLFSGMIVQPILSALGGSLYPLTTAWDTGATLGPCGAGGGLR